MANRYPYVHVPVSPDDVELVGLELWELGANGVEERDATTLNSPDKGGGLTLVASFEQEADAQAAVDALLERWPARLHFVEGDAWRVAYKEYFKATRVGARLVVRPPWENYEAAAGDVVLVLDPGAAFGTGTHETTRLVLEELQFHVPQAERVLDVGCGSGILAIASLLLGAGRARAVDNDPEALRIAAENAEVNAVGARLQIDAGTDAQGEALAGVTERYPLVLANIETRVLVPLAPALMNTVEPGGVLILSGVLGFERDRVREAYSQFEALRIRELGEWAALVLQRPAADEGR